MTKSVKERGIIFNGEMVKAILDGRKTQTRRVVKLQPESNQHGMRVVSESGVKSDIGKFFWSEFNATGLKSKSPLFNCPFGKVGDRLWVKETFGFSIRSVGGSPHKQLVFRESRPDAVHYYDCNGVPSPMKWSPPSRMPREYSRITLEITDIRVERLHDISEEDAKAEGVRQGVRKIHHGADNELIYCNYLSSKRDDASEWFDSPVDSFLSLWESIYGAESWQHGPWVWVVEFKRVEAA